MLVPRFWARTEPTLVTIEGVEYQLQSWGCSAISQADAQADAQRRLDATVARAQQGTHPDHAYPYRTNLVREELLHELPGVQDKEPAAIVTRNRYGSLVLNTAGVLFLDIDLPPDTLLRRLLALLRGSSQSLEERVLEGLRRVLDAGQHGEFRLYRTAAGFRALCTSRLYEPGSKESEALMRAARVDRAFMMLCRVQKCFRARLTPKPWRVGVPMPRHSYPFESPALEAAFRDWLQSYDAASSGYATCRAIETSTLANVHPEVRPIMELHDLATRCESGLPLA